MPVSQLFIIKAYFYRREAMEAQQKAAAYARKHAAGETVRFMHTLNQDLTVFLRSQDEAKTDLARLVEVRILRVTQLFMFVKKIQCFIRYESGVKKQPPKSCKRRQTQPPKKLC
jgi:hypothetical protein